MSAIAQPLPERASGREPRRLAARPLRPRRARSTALRVVAVVHRVLYRSSRGRVGGSVCGRPVLLLTTRGRRSGRARTVPVCFLAASGELVVAAAAGGRARHPAWYLNLRVDPHVTVQLGAVRRPMVAHTAGGVERTRLWQRLCRQYPVCGGYEERSGRVIPVVVLRPAAATAVVP